MYSKYLYNVKSIDKKSTGNETKNYEFRLKELNI